MSRYDSRSPPRRGDRLPLSSKTSEDDHRHRHHHSRDRDPARNRDGARKRSRSRSRDAPRKRRSRSPGDQQNYDRSRSRREERVREDSPGKFRRSTRPLPSQVDAFKGTTDSPQPGPEKQKPTMRPSGLLAAAANTVSTAAGAVVLKYHEPQEARKPPSSQHWRLYVFKGQDILDTLDLFSQSCWLFGRETSVCDYAIEHSSCSKQHAVIQFRYIEKRNEFGDKIGRVKPYVLDLESANGTTVNGEDIPSGRYVELRDKDVIKFGHSTREYVLQLPTG